MAQCWPPRVDHLTSDSRGKALEARSSVKDTAMATALDQLAHVSKALKTHSGTSDVPYSLTAAQDQVTTCLDGFREFSPATLSTPAGKSLQVRLYALRACSYFAGRAGLAVSCAGPSEHVPARSVLPATSSAHQPPPWLSETVPATLPPPSQPQAMALVSPRTGRVAWGAVGFVAALIAVLATCHAVDNYYILHPPAFCADTSDPRYCVEQLRDVRRKLGVLPAPTSELAPGLVANITAGMQRVMARVSAIKKSRGAANMSGAVTTDCLDLVLKSLHNLDLSRPFRNDPISLLPYTPYYRGFLKQPKSFDTSQTPSPSCRAPSPHHTPRPPRSPLSTARTPTSFPQTTNAFYHLAKAAAALKARTNSEDVPFWITAARDQLTTCLDGIWEFAVDTFKSHAGKSLTSHGKNLKKSFDTAIALALLAAAARRSAQKLPSPRRETLEGGGPGEPPSWVEAGMYERIRELQARMQGDHAEAQAWAERGRKLQLAKVKKLKPNAVVGRNERYKKINDALKAAPKTGLYVVYIKAGTYKEKVLVSREGVILVGDGASKTIITGKDSVAGGFTTYNTATVSVKKNYFQAAGIKFENTAGIQGNQAVALMIDADKAVVYDCSVTGYQDTLYTHSGRQYYRNSFISGITDFIFGNAAAVIDNCTIEMRAGKSNIPITASGRESETPTGIVIRYSFVTAEKGQISKEGWSTWNGDTYGKCVYYAEKDSEGPGGNKPDVLCAKGNPSHTSTPLHTPLYPQQQINKEGWSTWNGDTYGKCVYYAEKDSEGPGAYKPRAKWVKPGQIRDGNRGLLSLSFSWANGMTPRKESSGILLSDKLWAWESK
ncbi:unnamed protein product [Closterium sp. NIES-64]|nr:unnamed protein product [Closterium sp. NIES-64]